METQVTLTVNGQEVQQADFNTVTEEAARSMDWLLGEVFLRTGGPAGGAGTAPDRWIIPAGSRRESSSNDVRRRPLLAVSGSANNSIKVFPFTAVLAALESNTTDAKSSLRKIRTVSHYGANNNNLATNIQLAASTNHRWDLIWAKIDIDVLDPAVTRFVKSGAGQASSQSIQVSKKTTLTLGVTQGVESGAPNPTRPAVPADSGSSYYIVLGYIFIAPGSTLTTTILSTDVHESFDPIPISPALGGSNVCPANGLYKVTGNAIVREGWPSSGARPTTHMPPSMVGKEERLLALRVIETGDASVQINASTVVDNTVDWRRRYFKTFVGQGQNFNDGFPHGVNPPTGANATWANGNGTLSSNAFSVQAGQSFVEDMTTISGGAVTTGARVLTLSDASVPALAATALVILYVDLADGQLKVWRNNVDAARYEMLWIEATAPFSNVDGDGL